ncbi:hypothetical protein N431DRAFT_73725 [Stipitochalara longipes BDJ]|nr:hypothetical protein N431DRAFT_73725 [Stipitochalara longipes BDJ]
MSMLLSQSSVLSYGTAITSYGNFVAVCTRAILQFPAWNRTSCSLRFEHCPSFGPMVLRLEARSRYRWQAIVRLLSHACSR